MTSWVLLHQKQLATLLLHGGWARCPLRKAPRFHALCTFGGSVLRCISCAFTCRTTNIATWKEWILLPSPLFICGAWESSAIVYCLVESFMNQRVMVLCRPRKANCVLQVVLQKFNVDFATFRFHGERSDACMYVGVCWVRYVLWWRMHVQFVAKLQ